ncbi:hypothetical protein [Hansschlegelia zhihuaiae]|nr:hypothetical protein [Hansschlegelia zhihuaiae]
MSRARGRGLAERLMLYASVAAKMVNAESIPQMMKTDSTGIGVVPV